MSRVHFFIATKTGTAGAILASAPNLFALHFPGQKPRLVYTPDGDDTRAVEMLLHRLSPHDAEGNPVAIERAGSTWTVWELLPVSLDWRHGPRAMRKLIRARFGAEVLGPYTKPEIERRDPALAALLFPNGCLPHVIAGEDPHRLGQVDYAPTQEEADADAEPDPEALFA